LNQELLRNNSSTITVAQGINFTRSKAVQDKEIENAFVAVENANSLFPGTVSTLVFPYDYFVTYFELADLELDLKTLKARADGFSVQLGIKFRNCIESFDSEAEHTLLRTILAEADFAICSSFPNSGNVSSAVASVVKDFTGFQSKMKSIKAEVAAVLGQTGWPSDGLSEAGQIIPSIENLREFWVQMGQWATTTSNPVYMFEAFDEPWKTDIRIRDEKNPRGAFGTGGHFGWWKRTDTFNTNPNSYHEKIQG
jgi:exo-beta-1,3-glucanase (GH17 family)